MVVRQLISTNCNGSLRDKLRDLISFRDNVRDLLGGGSSDRLTVTFQTGISLY